MNGNNLINLMERLFIIITAGISFYELLGIYIARKKKLTTNLSRLITHLFLTLFCIFLFCYSYYWDNYLNSLSQTKWDGIKTINWPFVLIILVVGGLIIYEFLGIYYARKLGKTKNLSRLISHFVMLVFFVGLLIISVIKWNVYLNELEKPIDLKTIKYIK